MPGDGGKHLLGGKQRKAAVLGRDARRLSGTHARYKVLQLAGELILRLAFQNAQLQMPAK